jgi:hypothetical protein
MRWCCPPGHGCNGQGDDEPCALDVCRAFENRIPEALLAVRRWEELERACEHRRSDRERRFRRRAYERVRDRALIALAMRAQGIEALPKKELPATAAGRMRGFRGRRRSQAGVPSQAAPAS